MPVVGIVLGVALSSAVPEAPVESTDGLHLTWDAPAGCPDAAAVRSHVDAQLEGRALPVDAVASVTGSDAEGWRLELVLRGPHGVDERQVHATACRALVEAAGLLIAVAADPRAEGEQAERPLEVPPAPTPSEPEPRSDPASPSEPEVAPASSPTSPAPVEPTADPTPRAVSLVRALVRVEGGAQFFSLLPEPVGAVLGGAVGLWPGRAPLRLEARGHYVFPQRATYPGSSVGGDIDLWTLGPSACFEPRRSGVSWPICGGLELGRIRGEGVGVAEPGVGRSLFVGLPLDVSVTWAPVRWLALWLSARTVVSLRRPRFHIRGLDPLFRAGPAALLGLAGVEARFP